MLSQDKQNLGEHLLIYPKIYLALKMLGFVHQPNLVSPTFLELVLFK